MHLGNVSPLPLEYSDYVKTGLKALLDNDDISHNTTVDTHAERLHDARVPHVVDSFVGTAGVVIWEDVEAALYVIRVLQREG